MNITFYDRLKAVAKIKSTNVTLLCTELSLSSGSLSRWKNGGIPNSKTLSRIADYFNVSVDYLLGNTDEPTPAETKKDPAEQKSAESDALTDEIMSMLARLTPDERKLISAQVKGILANRDGV